MSQFKIGWIDYFREPECAPNPTYPDGVDVDASYGADAACQTDLPYPAKRCGIYLVQCRACGLKCTVTTAGRPDDPRSLKVACKPRTGTIQ